MKSKIVNLAPARKLLKRHRQFKDGDIFGFRGIDILVNEDVFNPTLTKVSGFLLDNIDIPKDSRVLDMFTGSGVLAIYSARMASRVMGLDVSQKAVDCSIKNADRLGMANKVEFHQSNLWDYFDKNKKEKFDVITANPPLLPVTPESLLEMAIADSPEMIVNTGFLKRCGEFLNDSGCVYMAFSNACSVIVGDPVKFISNIADISGLSMNVVAKWDVGYEIYRILKFTRKDFE